LQEWYVRMIFYKGPVVNLQICEIWAVSEKLSPGKYILGDFRWIQREKRWYCMIVVDTRERELFKAE
jgi:hypothetical protein